MAPLMLEPVRGAQVRAYYEPDLGGKPFVMIRLFSSKFGPQVGQVEWTQEKDVDAVINALKEAKATAFPKSPKPLCPASKELLGYLRRHRDITPIKAREELGIEHLPRRIKDLKEHGHKIVTEFKKGWAGKRYAHYVLKEEPQVSAGG
ncbi:Helix-turn-helix domain-containing protein [Enhydrobacter aerosaccus]|uniref:Helix-turn-helix domain-containing protein n=1 Tax=Enhydrobacter aerosaccus TaxID=225324 RepID=A0A1T4RNV5_9HYPH|nr:helix-turn-helix domain-containing protein [Enhydrobacter aerosaccus]SKA17557.1 Helix-turn-helix domain-containing protein [Enhydrobacter aerosaccus]